MEITRRPTHSVAEGVARLILAEIRHGRYRPGDRLPTEPELARQLGVGRTSVREGIGQLRILGVIEVRRGVGTYVKSSEVSDAQLAFHEWSVANQYQIVDLFEVRMSLEGTAAALAAQRAHELEHEELLVRARAHLRAHFDGDTDALVETDQAFHVAMVSTAHNEVLSRIYANLVPQLVDYRRKSLALEGAAERSSHDHLRMVDAIKARDPGRARAVTLAHLSSLYRELMDATQAPGASDIFALVL